MNLKYEIKQENEEITNHSTLNSLTPLNSFNRDDFSSVHGECVATWKFLRLACQYKRNQYVRTNFHLKLDSLDQICSKNGKSDYNHAILHTGSSLESFTKYLRLTVVFMSNSALQETFNFCFSRGFC